MSRLSVIALTLAAIGGVTALLVDPPVSLQASSPGTQQVGSINVSGKVIAGTFSATSSAAGAQVVQGDATGTGSTFGGLFKSSSPNGTGVRGLATSTSGSAFGGSFQTFGSEGAGVLALASSPTGITFGGFFRNASDNGRGVQAEATATTGVNYGGLFSSSSVGGFGAQVQNSSGGVALRALSSGKALDVVGSSSFSGTAVFNASPPFAVTSATNVTNLNADQVDGYHAGELGRLTGNQTWSAKNTFMGNTGFGGAPSATKRINIVGDAEVSGNLKAGSLSFPQATKQQWVSAHSFPGATGAISDPNQPTLSPLTSAHQYYAQVSLPEGATVTKLSAYIGDSHSNAPVTIYLLRRAASTAGAGGTMAQFSSDGEFSNTYSDSTISSAVIVNASYIYLIRVDMPGKAGLYPEVAPICITYMIDKAF